jgi:hypothetical protein
MTEAVEYVKFLFKSRSQALIEAQKRYYEKTKTQRIQKILDRYKNDDEFRLKHIEGVRRCRAKKLNADRA